MKFPKLFETGYIGSLQLKNRIIMPPMVAGYMTAEGQVSDQLISYYTARAAGGAALIVVESSYPRSTGYPGRIYVNDDNCIPGLRRLVENIHHAGAKAAIQMNPHRGRADEHDPASSSVVPHPWTGVIPRELTVNEIKELIEEFGEGARRAKEAGFDAIMIHGASGYIVSEFLSPRINKRADEYGGDIKGRAKFALELLEITKQKTNSDYPVIFRLTADEKLKNGFGLEDAVLLSKLLEEAGADALDVTSGVAESFDSTVPYMYYPRACNTYLSESIKKQVKIPIIVAGRINDPYVAEEVLSKAQADFIDLGRALIADPEFPRKAIEGQPEDIRKCIACLRCIEAVVFQHQPMRCTVNPTCGREREFKVEPAERKKKILVIGGGPAGMEATIVAAQRGHEVTLWEATDKLGGQLNLALIPPDKGELNNLSQYLSIQLERSKAKVELNKKATPEAIIEFAPDVVILATGSKPFVPEIKGKEKALTVKDVLSGEARVGRNVIVVGAGFIGCETAEFLHDQGKQITIVEILDEVAADSIYSIKKPLKERLEKRGIKVFTGVKQEEVTDRGMEIVDRDGNKVSLEADDIVIATGSTPDESLQKALQGKIAELYSVGDCVEARRLLEAVHEGAEVALKV